MIFCALTDPVSLVGSLASAASSAIGGGGASILSAASSAIVGGGASVASAASSAIGGGGASVASAASSAIVGAASSASSLVSDASSSVAGGASSEPKPDPGACFRTHADTGPRCIFRRIVCYIVRRSVC